MVPLAWWPKQSNVTGPAMSSMIMEEISINPHIQRRLLPVKASARSSDSLRNLLMCGKVAWITGPIRACKPRSGRSAAEKNPGLHVASEHSHEKYVGAGVQAYRRRGNKQVPSIHKHLPDLADQRHPQRKVEHAHGNSQPNQSSQYCARGEDSYRFKSVLWPMHKDKDQHHRYKSGESRNYGDEAHPLNSPAVICSRMRADALASP